MLGIHKLWCQKQRRIELFHHTDLVTCNKSSVAQRQQHMVLTFPKRLLQHARGVCPPDDPHADGARGSDEEPGCRPLEPACVLHSSLGA